MPIKLISLVLATTDSYSDTVPFNVMLNTTQHGIGQLSLASLRGR